MCQEKYGWTDRFWVGGTHTWGVSSIVCTFYLLAFGAPLDLMCWDSGSEHMGHFCMYLSQYLCIYPPNIHPLGFNTLYMCWEWVHVPFLYVAWPVLVYIYTLLDMYFPAHILSLILDILYSIDSANMWLSRKIEKILFPGSEKNGCDMWQPNQSKWCSITYHSFPIGSQPHSSQLMGVLAVLFDPIIQIQTSITVQLSTAWELTLAKWHKKWQATRGINDDNTYTPILSDPKKWLMNFKFPNNNSMNYQPASTKLLKVWWRLQSGDDKLL